MTIKPFILRHKRDQNYVNSRTTFLHHLHGILVKNHKIPMISQRKDDLMVDDQAVRNTGNGN